MSTGTSANFVKQGFRLVLDTNVYYSALVHAGAPSKLWRRLINREYLLSISPHIVRELARALRTKEDWTDDQINRELKAISRVATIVQPTIRVTVFSGTQEADNRILECALAASAHLIVSGDGDLLRLGFFDGIPILRPADALRILPPEPR